MPHSVRWTLPVDGVVAMTVLWVPTSSTDSTRRPGLATFDCFFIRSRPTMPRMNAQTEDQKRDIPIKTKNTMIISE